MFDAQVECEASMSAHETTGRERKISLHLPLPRRIHCDPAVYLSVARRYCDVLAHDPSLRTLDVTLRSRRSSDPELHDVLDLRDVCHAPPAYRLIGHNPWIKP